jgi:hypothetical protein
LDSALGDDDASIPPIGEKEGFPMTHHVLRFAVLPLVLTAASCTGTIEDAGPGNQATGATGGTNPTGAGGSSGSTAGSGTGGTVAATGGTGGTGGGTGGAGGSLPTGGTGGSVALPDPASSIDLEGDPAYYRVVRLTVEQWRNSVQSVLRLPTAPAADSLQGAVSGMTDFTNNEVLLSVDERAWTDFQAAAETIAATVTSDAALLSGVYPGMDGPGFITAVGLRAYRRPLTPAEVSGYQTLFDSGAALSGDKSAFAKGAMVVLEAMLQSPHFLYRMELGAEGAPLSSYEVAAKLSLWLRNTTPNDALLDAAATPGNLDTADGAAAVAQQMLEEPAAKAVMRDFHRQVLDFDAFEGLSKAGVAGYDESINPELAESSYLFFDRIFSQGLGVADVFLSTTGFVGTQLAGLYGGGNAPSAGSFAERDFAGTRRGYFTQIPFLMLHARNAQQDAIHRGVSMAFGMLCAPLGFFEGELPPLPARKPGQTQRQLVTEHTGECGLACHKATINPLGFAFEQFDGMGNFRTTEEYPGESLTIDASGTFEFAGGTKTWQDADGFMQLLASEPQTHICYAKKLAGYGLQRDIVVADAPLLATMATASVSSAASLKQLMLALVKQDAFRIRVGGVQ